MKLSVMEKQVHKMLKKSPKKFIVALHNAMVHGDVFEERETPVSEDGLAQLYVQVDLMKAIFSTLSKKGKK